MAEPDSERAPGRMTRLRERVADRARRLDTSERLLRTAKLGRQMLPGDSEYGDPLSTGGSEHAHIVGRRVAATDRPGVARELGLTALQLWQAASEAQGRGRGDETVTVLFSDLVDFSTWALEAGDDASLDLLRDVARAIEPPVAAHGGKVVKRLGDGMMAVFDEPQAALDAILEGCERLSEVHAGDYDPRLRAGIHVGRPRRLGGDYLGVDVNIAARLAEEAAPGELLVSDEALARLDAATLDTRRKRRFKVKGVPRDLGAHSVARA